MEGTNGREEEIYEWASSATHVDEGTKRCQEYTSEDCPPEPFTQHPPHPVKDYGERMNAPPILVWPATERAVENDGWCVETSHPDNNGTACTAGMPEERGSITLVKKSSREETAAESDESVTNEEMDISSEVDDEGSSDGEIAIGNEENEERQKVPPDKETSPPTGGSDRKSVV